MPSDSSPPEPSLFSVPERIGFSVLAMALAGAITGFARELDESDSDSPLPPGLSFPADEWLWPALLLVLGCLCFVFLRRHPLGVVRACWGLIAVDVVVIAARIPALVNPSLHGFYLYLIDVNPSVAALAHRPVTGWSLLPLLGLVFLAGALSQASHLALMREELDAALDYNDDHYDRIVRRQRLIRAVRGSDPPLYAVLSRCMILLLIPIFFAVKIADVAWEIRLLEYDFPAPRVSTAENVARLPGFQRVVIDENGHISLDGNVVARASESDCPQLTSSLARLRQSSGTSLQVGLVSNHDVHFQRIIEALEAIRNAGIREIIFLDEPTP